METTRRRVGLAQALLGLLALGAAGLNFQCQLGFLLGGQQRHAANFLQVDLDGVVNRDAVGSQAVLVVVRALLGARQGVADVNGVSSTISMPLLSSSS